MESKHTLILIDGKRVPGSNDVIGPNTDYQHDWVAIDEIERIEVVRGPMSVLYGSDAMGGVINIITKKTKDEWTGTIKYSRRMVGDEKGGEGYGIETQGGGAISDNMQLSLAAMRSRRSELDSLVDPRVSAIEGKENSHGTMTINWHPSERQDIALGYTLGEEERWYNTLTRAGMSYVSSYDIRRTQKSLAWSGDVGESSSSARIYQNEIDIVNQASNGVTATDPQTLTDTIMEGNTRFAIGTKQLISLGFESRKETLRNPKLNSGEADVTMNSIWLQDELEMSDKGLMTLGARWDEHQYFGMEASPRVALVHDINEEWTLRASYGKGFRAPTLKQVAPDYTFQAGMVIINSNPELEPERNSVWEIAANYNIERLEMSVGVFDNRIDNLIDTKLDTTYPSGIQVWSYDNIDEARIQGAELSANIDVTSNSKIKSSYQYMDAKNGDGEKLAQRPRHTAGIGFEWVRATWSYSIDAAYLGKQHIMANNNVLTELPGYTLWNTSIIKSLSKHVNVAMRMDNVTDVRLEEKSTAFRHEEYPRSLRIEISAKL
jgi:outer membrane receptor for ferrienterochelin and colicins